MSAPEEAHGEGAPEWMVSFADMVTILMAFFVVMYSMAGTKDVQKEQAVLRSLRRHLGQWPAIPKGLFVPPDSRLARLVGLGPGDDSGEHRLVGPDGTERGGSLTVRTAQPHTAPAVGHYILFEQGSTGLSEESRRNLDLIVEALAGKPQRIEIRGHTSRRPLAGGAGFRDHWDLAYARCRQTMQYLVSRGIDADRIRLGVAGQYGAERIASALALTDKDSRVDVFMINEFIQQFSGAVPAAGPGEDQAEGLSDDPIQQSSPQP